MTEAPVIVDRTGRPGLIESSGADRVRVRLANGAVVDLPASMVTQSDSGNWLADAEFEALGAQATEVLHEVEERVHVSTKIQETGRIVARTVTDTREEPVAADGWRETVQVERVPVGRVVEAVEAPREEQGVTVIPVYEEVLVVHKQLVLVEEVRLTTRREPVPGPERVTLRRQHVEIDRLPPDDAGA